MTELVRLFREVANGSLRGVQQTLASSPALVAARDTRTEQTPLHVAALLGHTDIIRELLATGFSHETHDRQGNLPLHLAAAKGDAGAVRELTVRGMEFSVRAKNREGQTPLHLAARGWHPDAAHELLKAGARPGTTDKEGRTALDLAGSHEELRQMLTLLQTSFPSLLAEPEHRSFRGTPDTPKRSSSSTSSPKYTAPPMRSESGILSERSENFSSVTRAKASAILDQARTKGSRVKVLRNELGENLPRQDSSGSGRSSTSQAGAPALQGLNDRLEGQRAKASVGSFGPINVMDSNHSGRLTDHEQRLGTAESNMRELRLAINRISDRLQAACMQHERSGTAGDEPIEQAHGLLDELSSRVAFLETRLALASPSAQSGSSRPGFAAPAAASFSPDGTTVLQSNALYADSSGSNQESTAHPDTDVSRAALARVEVSMEQHRILVEEQGMLLRQVENRVEMIMRALEEKTSEMLQGASQGGSHASISEMLGHEIDRVQQALEHRFSRIESDIETLIQQEWKICAAAEAAAERQIQVRMGEQDRHLRDRDSRLLALQRQHLEDDRQGYEALMQQLQQGLSALGSRLALLERTAGRDAAHASQALLYDDPRAERLLSGSSIASSQQVVNEVMRSDVVITPPGSHPSSRPSSRQESEGRHQASGDQLREPVLDAACAGYSRPSQPSSRMRPMDPERIPLNSMPDSVRPRQEMRHANLERLPPADHGSRWSERPGNPALGNRAHGGDGGDMDQPAARVYAAAAAAAAFQGLPPGEPRLQGSPERGRHSRRGSGHRPDRSRSQDDRGLHGEMPGDPLPHTDDVNTSEGHRRDSSRYQARPARPSSSRQPSGQRPPASLRSAATPGLYINDLTQDASYDVAPSHQEATFPPRPGMDTLPEEDIQADERALLPSSNVAASPSKQQRFIKRLSKPGNSCKGCFSSSGSSYTPAPSEMQRQCSQHFADRLDQPDNQHYGTQSIPERGHDEENGAQARMDCWASSTKHMVSTPPRKASTPACQSREPLSDITYMYPTATSDIARPLFATHSLQKPSTSQINSSKRPRLVNSGSALSKLHSMR
ncbi:hypothetical protein WJX74_007954 [Apatococcus lobatus]|uniref:Uncharacterized protein n=1 Tax=Apatococcus lobatus TaxID=904363 RepID=A0AAW1S681_9CHLO